MQQIDWNEINKSSYIYEEGCWTTCNGGFCCKHDHPDFNFRLIPKNGTMLLYMKNEYQYLSNEGKVSSTPGQTIALDFGGPSDLELISVPCKLLGLCNGVIDKPLLCKLYPFIPIISNQGEVVDLSLSSIFDLTFQIMNWPSPCTVQMTKKQSYLKKYQDDKKLIQYLYNPSIMFYLHSAKSFIEVYTEGLMAHSELRAMSGKEFWSEWELAYLSGDLVNKDLLISKILGNYKNLRNHFGEFSY